MVPRKEIYIPQVNGIHPGKTKKQKVALKPVDNSATKKQLSRLTVNLSAIKSGVFSNDWIEVKYVM